MCVCVCVCVCLLPKQQGTTGSVGKVFSDFCSLVVGSLGDDVFGWRGKGVSIVA